jgi:hypothetical protein
MTIEVKMIEWFDDHFYRIQTDAGVIFLPSVTTVLFASPKPFLAQWRGEVGNDEANKKFWDATEKGSRIHNACEIYDKDGVIVYQPWGRPNYSEEEIKALAEQHSGKVCILHDQDELWQVYKWRRWKEETGALVIETEMIVYSLETGVAGTLDRVVGLMPGEYYVNGAKPIVIENPGKYILDLKSSKQIDDDYYLQVSAYQKLYEAMTGNEIAGRIIVHTNSTTKKGIEGLSTHLRDNTTLQDDFEAFLHIKATWERKFSGMKPRVFDMPSVLSTVIEKGEEECHTQEKQ